MGHSARGFKRIPGSFIDEAFAKQSTILRFPFITIPGDMIGVRTPSPMLDDRFHVVRNWGEERGTRRMSELVPSGEEVA